MSRRRVAATIPHDPTFAPWGADYQNTEHYIMSAKRLGLNYLEKMFPGEVCVLRKEMTRQLRKPRETHPDDVISGKPDDEPFKFRTRTLNTRAREAALESCVLTVAPWVRSSLMECRKRFVVASLTIWCLHWPHQNAIVFDSQARTMVRFEPHGPWFEPGRRADEDTAVAHMVYEVLDAQLAQWMNATVPDMYTTYSSVGGWQRAERDDVETRRLSLAVNEVCGVKFPGIPVSEWTVERSDSGGYCVTWSWLFLHLRLANPQLTEKEIVDQLQLYGPRDLMQLVMMYANVLGAEVERRLEMPSTRREDFEGGVKGDWLL